MKIRNHMIMLIFKAALMIWIHQYVHTCLKVIVIIKP